MLALARGDFNAAGEHTSEAARLSGPWGESMAREALMGQMGWLLYETGQIDGLTEALADLAEQSVSAQNDPVLVTRRRTHSRRERRNGAGHPPAQGSQRQLWRVQRPAPRAVAYCGTCHGRDGHRSPGPGQSCCRQTKQAAWENASLTSSSHIRTHSWSQDGQRSCSAASTATSDSPTWPPGKPATAAVHLARAADENSEFAVLHTRTQFDLARALVRQSDSRHEGVTEMERVEHRAAELGMAGLAAQAAAERDQWSRLEP